MRHFRNHGYPIEEIGSCNTHIRLRLFFNKWSEPAAITACRHASEQWKKDCLEGKFGKKYHSFHFVTSHLPQYNAFQIDFDFLDVSDEVIESVIYGIEDLFAKYGDGSNKIIKVIISYGVL